MFRIRRILDSSAPANKLAIDQVQSILRQQFNGVNDEEIEALPAKLNNPLKYKFQSRLLVAEKKQGILGFALMLHVPDVGFCYLDFMAAGTGRTGQGLGGAIYERVREEARDLGAEYLLMECLPDDPKLSPDSTVRKQNEQRLAFYERYGAFPISGTRYETPVKPEDTDPPYLVIDSLGFPLPEGKVLKKAVQAILERKYGDLCDPAYTKMIVNSFPTQDISLRPAKYSKSSVANTKELQHIEKIVLIANEGHEIHHVSEHGYVESPVRLKVILRELEKLTFIERKAPTPYSDKHILAVHDSDYVSFLKKACMNVPKGKSVYPYVFPIRNQNRKPLDTPLLAGYYCIDTFTPLNADAYKAARTAVDAVLTATESVLAGGKAAYALVRPPGHHAERKAFGGFCYFANTAIAANYLSQYGKVATLDIDYHHGNSQQDIFYKRSDVLTISIHGNPKFAYPYFTGFADEIGEGSGYGFNINMPLPEELSPEDYIKQLEKALKKIKDFAPTFLVLALGLDTAKADPTGTWALKTNHFSSIGYLIASLSLPTVVVQEGGYRTQTLGHNARHFFNGFYKALSEDKPSTSPKKVKRSPKPKRLIRRKALLSDVESLKSLTAEATVFSKEEIEIAGELVAEIARHGEEKSGYSIIILEEGGEALGYSIFGKIPLTESSYDVYWLVVGNRYKRQGLASHIMDITEASIKKNNGAQIFIETSSTSKYQPARSFYERLGYKLSADQKDFYRPGDHKITYVKTI